MSCSSVPCCLRCTALPTHAQLPPVPCTAGPIVHPLARGACQSTRLFRNLPRPDDAGLPRRRGASQPCGSGALDPWRLRASLPGGQCAVEAGPSSASTVEAPSRARTSEICNACSDAYRALEVAGQRPPCRRPNGLHKELPGGVVMSNASLIPRAKMNIRTASIDKELPGRVGTGRRRGGRLFRRVCTS